MTTKKRVLVPLAPGFEELEAVAVVDCLRRADVHVVTASVGAKNPITGRSRIRVMADIDLDEALAEWGEDWDAVVLPGGDKGVEGLAASDAIVGIVRRRLAAGQLVGAICAAPIVLQKAGLAAGTALTSYPSIEGMFAGFDYRHSAVVVAGALITSRGPGTAIAFALALVTALLGPEAADAVRRETVSAEA